MWFILASMAWKRKLFFLLLVSVTLAITPPAVYMFEKVKQILIEETQEKALDIAVCVAAFLEEDIEQYRVLSEALVLEENSPLIAYYRSANSILKAIRLKTDATYVFTAKYLNEHTNAYVLDGEDPESEFFSPFGSTDRMTSSALWTYTHGREIASGIEEDPIWGSYLTGYAPIIDERDHTVVGWVGVDYASSVLDTRFTRLSWIIGLAFSFFILITSTLLSILIQAIHDKATTDYLTKLGNKRAFSRVLQKLCKEAEKNKLTFILLMIDVNKFKYINDHYGHQVGDIVLAEIARAIKNALAFNQGCYRYGGDEFTILLPDCTPARAMLVQKDIHREIEKISVQELDGQKVSVSIGMAEWNKTIGCEQLIIQADQALYEAKRHPTAILEP